jgi:hypothetical protein
MTRVMRDSTVPTDIPLEGCDFFAGYVNGNESKWPATSWSRFPENSTLKGDVLGNSPAADFYDVEVGNPTDTPGFPVTVKVVGQALEWKDRTYLPILYCNRSTLTPLFDAMNAKGYYVNKHFKLWIATLDGTETVEDMTGVFAIQYKGQKQTGGHYDESLVYDDTFRPTKVVTTPPIAKQVGVLITPDMKARDLSSVDGGKTWL